MSAITRYVGTDPNGTTSSMAQVQVTTNGFLNIATIPADEKYVFRFWVKANSIQSCQVLQENESILDFQTSNDWQEKIIKFDGTTGSPILFYLPVGTYFFWHSKLEVGTMESDYSQSQQDFEDLITETTATFNSRIEQTARSITSEVSRAVNAETMAFSQIAQLADRIVLKVDSQGKLVEVALGVDADKSQSYFTVDADNISITGTQLVEIISESDATISANNLYLTGEEVVSIISSGNAQIQANNIGLTGDDVVRIISSGLAQIQARNIGLTSTDVVSIISSGTAEILAKNIGLTSEDVVSIISSGTAKIQAQNIEISASNIGGMDAYYTKNQTDSQINQKASEIESTVATYQEKYDISVLTDVYPPGISFYGYGNPNTVHPYKAEEWGTMSTVIAYGTNALTYGQNKIIYGRKYYLDQETGKVWYTTSLMTQWNDSGITLPLLTDSIYSKINQTDESITSEVKRASTKEGELYSQIKQNAESIVLSVDDNGNVVAVELSADRSTGTTNFTVGADNISLEGKTINLTSDNIEISSTNFSVDESGSVTANDLTITGGSVAIGNNFAVDNQGNMTASSVDITGGTLNINNNFTVNANGNVSASNISITGGAIVIGDDFSVSPLGHVTANALTITGGSINIGDAFDVDDAGNVTAESVTITGGSISIGGNFEVDSNGNLSATALDELRMIVANSQITYDETGYTVDYYDFGNPNYSTEYPPKSANNGKYCLDQESGKLYVCRYMNGRYIWYLHTTLPTYTTSLSSQISQTADEIKMTVAESQGKYDEGYYSIDYYDFGSPNDKYSPSSTYSGKYYLNVENGTLYKCTSHTYYYSWDTVQTLPLITDELSSRISQTATGISFSLTKSGEDTAVLSMTYTKEDGSVISLSSQRITFNGLVEFTDLSGNGTTTINGNNITTGTISADRIDVTGLFAKDITATGTIRGVTLMGADVYSKDTLKMFYSYGTSSDYVTVLSITRQASFTLPTGVTVSNVPITSVGGGDYVTFSGMTRFLDDVYLSDFLHINKNINFYDDSTGIYFSKAGKILRSSGTNSENVSFYDIRNSKWLIDIQSAGTYFKTTAYTSSGAVVTSDRNAKHDIVDIDIEESNNFIQSLKPVSFKYNDGTSDRDHHGFIAQDVKESMGDKDWGIYIDDKGNKGLRYEEIIADLVGTVQYQNSIINELRSELSAIQQRLSLLGV